MEKRKILIVDDDYAKQEAFVNEAKVYERLADITDAEVAFTKDTSMYVAGDFPKARMKLEIEGPEWVEYDPAFLESLADAEVIIVHYSAVGAKFFEAAKNLKLLCVMRSGLENVNLEAAKAHGVTVCSSPGRAAVPVADGATMYILAINKSIQYSNMSPDGKWRPFTPPYRPMMMNECTVGIVGFGMIGQLVAKRLRAFDANVIAYDPFPNHAVAAELGVQIVDTLDELMSTADIVSVHARLDESTHHMIGAHQFSLCKPNCLFVNTARAGLVDEEALIDALQTKKIAGAALDVFNQEPLPDGHPFLCMKNVITTPHCVAAVGTFVARSVKVSLENVHRYFAGEPVLYAAKFE